MTDRITITVSAGGDDADARAFRNALGDVLDMLDALAEEKFGRQSIPEWKIAALEKRSPAKITIENNAKLKLATALIVGLASLQSRGQTSFGLSVTKIAKRFSERATKERDLISLEVSGKPKFTPTPDLARRASGVLDKHFYEMPSSVDGKLDIVNVHQGPKFSIFDDISNREIRCNFPDSLIDTVKKNLGKRITATGIVKFNSMSDNPTSIVVDDIIPLEDGESPSLFQEMPAMLLGDDVPPEKILRELRDGR